jgi:predicted 3-demethylubiquinone-9 3-methyltransferase (glyoxalase superfamily)
MNKIEKITPFLWFDTQAEEAANFYVSVFGNSSVKKVVRNGEAVMVVDFLLDGQKFTALNAGPMFKFNPSISFFVVCETEAETDLVWQKLSEGGQVMIPLEKQVWSEKYGFLQDRYGLAWQISLGEIAEVGQKITPSLLFTGPQQGQGAAAVQLYTALFGESSITGIQRYEAGEEGPEGWVKHAQFQLEGQTFMIMDNPMNQAYTFNEAISFVVNCGTQAEVDFFWNGLIADGGEESNCGWLKDKFGVSWQIIPEALPLLLADPDPAVAQRAMNAMLKMRKIEIEKLT